MTTTLNESARLLSAANTTSAAMAPAERCPCKERPGNSGTLPAAAPEPLRDYRQPVFIL